MQNLLVKKYFLRVNSQKFNNCGCSSAIHFSLRKKTFKLSLKNRVIWENYFSNSEIPSTDITAATGKSS